MEGRYLNGIRDIKMRTKEQLTSDGIEQDEINQDKTKRFLINFKEYLNNNRKWRIW